MRIVKKLDEREIQAYWVSVAQALELKRIMERWEGPFSMDGITALVFKRGALRVLVDLEDHGGDGSWLHVSVSRYSGRLPEYAEMTEVRRSFIPPDRVAVEIWAPGDEHYSKAEVRHLWCRMDARAVPDLRCIDESGKGV